MIKYLILMCLYLDNFVSLTEVNVSSLFASKNPYSTAHGEMFSAAEHKGLTFLPDQNRSCSAIQINTLFRHGARNPKYKDITTTRTFVNALKQYGNNIPQEIYQWNPKFDPSEEKHLTEAGERELQSLGQKYINVFKDILNPDINKILYMTSNTNRTIGSCQSFKSAFESPLLDDASEEHYQLKNCTINNYLIRFYDICKKYVTKVEKHDPALQEVKGFQNGKEVKSIISTIQKRFGLDESFVFSYRDLKAVYTVAGTEMANYGRSPLANVFTTNELEVLEYASDLKSYWKKSYGHTINYEQSCPLLRDIFSHLEDATKNEKGYYKGVFRFGHAETIIPLLTILQLYKDEEKLTSHNYARQSNRKFRTGKISQFAANIAFVMYRCDTPSAPEYQLLLLHNEHLINFPCCPDTFLCPYTVVKDFYRNYLDSCNFEEICEMEEEENLQSKNEL